jgi:Threonyl-tRNA synthetase
MNERKTLDDRNQMTELERIRHSCAHVMATAILRLWPDAQFGLLINFNVPVLIQGVKRLVNNYHPVASDGLPVKNSFSL